jgi:hypothetical protein
MGKQVTLSSLRWFREFSSPKSTQLEQVCDYHQFTTLAVSTVISLGVHPLLEQ